MIFFFFSSRRRHTRFDCDWSSDVCSSDLVVEVRQQRVRLPRGDVTIRTEVPDHWSVVARTGALRPTLRGQGSDVVTTYAVCPLCPYRQDYAGKPRRPKCVRRGATSPDGWSETC